MHTTLSQQLRNAIGNLNRRALRKSAVWCAELLLGLGHPNPLPASELLASEPLSDVYLIAKTYFDCGEFQRAAFRLSPDNTLCASALDGFLWAYALYLAGEKRKEEAIREGAKDAVNLNLDLLLAQLSAPSAAIVRKDGYLSWLFGVCLREKGGREADARGALVRAVTLAPWHWSAWLDLGSLYADPESYAALQLDNEDHLAARAFRGHMFLEHFLFDEAVEFHRRLLRDVPTSPFALAQMAQALYGAAEFDEALQTFAALEDRDPYRLSNVDTLAYLYYVREAKAELSTLARRAVQLDKFKVETCCVVGNYFALKGQHEHAVAYFKRALRHNRRYQGVHTLLGHEFVELKNLPAAIEAYRAAVDINPRDFRAWYGLGQAYEIAKMHFYSLYYYRKTTVLRPKDARMWCALGGSLEKTGLAKEAIRCYRRADDLDDPEGIATLALARLYKQQHDGDNAFSFYHKHLLRRQSEGTLHGPPVVEGLRFVAAFLRDRNKLDAALQYAEHLQRVSPGDKEAEALLRDIQSRRGVL